MEWPPRSPDLKSVVYENRPPTLHDLKDAIITDCQEMTGETLVRVKHSFIQRINACTQAQAEQFDHLL